MDNLPKGESYIKMGVKGADIFMKESVWKKSDGMEIGYGLFCV